MDKTSFFEMLQLNPEKLCTLIQEPLKKADDGELFIEYKLSENYLLEDSCIKDASSSTLKGFGLRIVAGETIGYAHSSKIDEDSIKAAANQLKSIPKNQKESFSSSPLKSLFPFYLANNPLEELSPQTKVELLEKIDLYARGLDPRVSQVIAKLFGNWQAVAILRPDGQVYTDFRPLITLYITVILKDKGRQESGSYGTGGRFLYDAFLQEDVWQGAVREAFRQALVNLDARPSPAGEMPVILGPGWPGILLHEAVGHGLEGDFNRKKTSAFSNLLGHRVAAKGVTVIDDGTIKNRRGSLTIDDEGTPTKETILIEDGILKGYLQDRLNGRLMGMASTGNGRRESYAHVPLPRMTNTFMLGGTSSVEEMVASIKRGIYAVNFGGGQVDITSGKFVFSSTEAYLIENGKLTSPLKGATLIGNGPDVLKQVEMIGGDLALDPGIGTCGKDGQSVPVGVGLPSLLVKSLTVGGTEC